MEEPREVPLEMFSDDELRQVWQKWFPNLEIPPMGSAQLWDRELLSNSRRAATAVDQHLIEALRNPTMLACFKVLDKDQRDAALSGKESAWDKWMREYIGWFTRKVSWRRELPEADVRIILATCAGTTCEAGASYDREADWLRPTDQVSDLLKTQVLRIFEDAVTSGLIETTAGPGKIPSERPVRWKWCYGFVANYLRSCA